jgi:hypothetical protein
MDLPKVVIKDNYEAYLSGSEVKAALVDSSSTPLQPGQHVLAFKDAIAATTDMPVPKRQQSHYIGIEGTVTQIQPVTEGISAAAGRKLVCVKKL